MIDRLPDSASDGKLWKRFQSGNKVSIHQTKNNFNTFFLISSVFSAKNAPDSKESGAFDRLAEYYQMFSRSL